jgi:alpha,alpha-trehalase
MGHGGTVVPVIDARRHDAVIFDMDGVVTDSASMHAAAWTELFDVLLDHRPAGAGQDRSPFTEDDYLRFVDGKPRYRGVADFLAARGIELPWRNSSDPETAETVCGLGNRKDLLFLEKVAREGVRVFGSTVTLIRRLGDAGVRTGVFSAGRHCADVLAAAGVADLFAVRVDGIVAEKLGLRGKPDPAMLLEAARRLGAEPDRTVVVEDAEAGVAAGRGGGFALVIGVGRHANADRLLAHGADFVVSDLAEVGLRGGFRRMSELPDALKYGSRIADLLGTEKPAFLMDFDGTVADIVADPADAQPIDGVAAVLAETFVSDPSRPRRHATEERRSPTSVRTALGCLAGESWAIVFGPNRDPAQRWVIALACNPSRPMLPMRRSTNRRRRRRYRRGSRRGSVASEPEDRLRGRAL